MKFIGIIPSRYSSSRFPGKPLIKIFGKSMIQRVYEQCIKSKSLSSVIVATDDERIHKHVLDFGGNVILTSKTHITGTERCNEVALGINQEIDVIVNIQGDEPYINPIQIDEITQLFNDPNTQICTLAKKINDIKIIKDKNKPKVIFDKNKNAVNFFRKEPNISKNQIYYQHIGIYAYKKNVLKEICTLTQSENEKIEQLEQLRWLDNNYKIKIGITEFETLSVDTADDLEKIKQKMEENV